MSEIAASDICKVADINRSTFYEKYDDISALADAYAKETEKQMVEQPHTKGEFDWLLEYAKANANMFNLYFKLAISKSCGEYKTIFFKNGMYSVLKMWLEGGCVESAEEMSKFLKTLVRSSLIEKRVNLLEAIYFYCLSLMRPHI